MGWETKDGPGLREAYAEMNRSRVGRKERLNKTAEGDVIVVDHVSQ